jgi:hypothetical protein
VLLIKEKGLVVNRMRNLHRINSINIHAHRKRSQI